MPDRPPRDTSIKVHLRRMASPNPDPVAADHAYEDAYGIPQLNIPLPRDEQGAPVLYPDPLAMLKMLMEREPQ